MENPDWHHRIVQRTGASVCVGAAAGVFYSLVKNEPALSTATRTAGSFGIIGATFFSLSELCRVLRQADGPENSVWAGAGTGALLRSLHHGRAFALPGAIGGSILALVSTGAASLWTHGIPDDSSAWAYLPVRRLSDEEVERRKRDFDQRVEMARQK